MQSTTGDLWCPKLETKPDFQRIMAINAMSATDDVRLMQPSAHPRAWGVPKLKDIRESKWDVYHGKFPQAQILTSQLPARF